MKSEKKKRVVIIITVVILIVIICFFLYLSYIHKKTFNDKCDMIPEYGPCDALFERYFLNKELGKCDKFIWGGCEGVVPFETMEDCKKYCE